jgi:hypothetical protein
MFCRPSSPPVTLCDEPDDLAEGDRQQREVDAALVRDARPHEGAEHGGDEDRAEQVEPEVRQHALLQESERVRTGAEEGAVAERRQAGGAEHQVVAEREQHPDHHLEREVLVEAESCQPERRRRQQQEQHEHRHRQETGARRGDGHAEGSGKRAGQEEMYVLGFA